MLSHPALLRIPLEQLDARVVEVARLLLAPDMAEKVAEAVAGVGLNLRGGAAQSRAGTGEGAEAGARTKAAVQGGAEAVAVACMTKGAAAWLAKALVQSPQLLTCQYHPQHTLLQLAHALARHVGMEVSMGAWVLRCMQPLSRQLPGIG